MGYSLGLLPGPHDPSTQRLPRHVTSLAAISHSAKPSVQPSGSSDCMTMSQHPMAASHLAHKVRTCPSGAGPGDAPELGPQTVNKSFATVASLAATNCRPSDVGRPTVLISPVASLRRRLMRRHGMIAELVQANSRERIEYRYRGSSHLLVAWEKGIRSDGETFVEDMPRSNLRNVTRKLIFVPAGRLYFEWQQQS